MGGVKSRVEVETEVGSPETLAHILASLGFIPRFRYEKFREVWRVGRAVIGLDHTPLGRFVEIEGTSVLLHRLAARLGLGADRFLGTSYPGLWVEAGRTGDMVFVPASRPASPPRWSGPRRGVRR